MKINVVGKKVLIKPDYRDEKTRGGLYIPETSQNKTETGTVLNIGDEEELKKITDKVQVGSKIVYDKYSDIGLSFDDQKYLIVKYEDILGVLT